MNARAWREVSPDEIFLSVTLDQNDTKGKYTIDQLERQLRDAVKKAGIDADKYLKVSDISSDLQRYLLKKNDTRTTKQYQLQVTNTQLMPLFEQLGKAEISRVELQSARYSKQAELYDELLGEAVATAKRRAGIMAAAAGQQLGTMIYAQTYDNSVAYHSATLARAQVKEVSMDMAGAGPALEFTTTRIEVNTTARFKIQ